MIVHKHLIDSLTLILTEIFRDSAYADKVISRELKAHKKWGSKDRRFFAEQVYECVRWWRQYWYLLGSEPSFDKVKLYQLWGIHCLVKGLQLPPWPELRGLAIDPQQFNKMNSLLAIQQSVPDWLYQRGADELGNRWPAILAALNRPAPVDIRVNLLKASVEQVIESLADDGVEVRPISGLDSGLELTERKNVFITKAFQSGFFEVQDRASQLIAPFLQVEVGQRVIDACAGAGGKSLHIANFLKNKGKLIAMDIHAWKLKELKERARRNGIDVIETKLIEGSKTIKRMEASFDRVLLDVPCSGLGVLRRNPDTKWKLSIESLQDLQGTQRSILHDYAKLAKVGGKMVYSTCSVLPSENEKQVDRFLQENSQWTMEESLRIDPDQGRGDGFFAARLLRVG